MLKIQVNIWKIDWLKDWSIDRLIDWMIAYLLSNIFHALELKESPTVVLEAFLAVNPEMLAFFEDEPLMSTPATQPTLQKERKNSPDERKINKNKWTRLRSHFWQKKPSNLKMKKSLHFYGRSKTGKYDWRKIFRVRKEVTKQA